MLFEELKDIGRQPDGTPVAAEDLLRLAVFKDISPQFLKKNANATVWRHFKRGEIVCREGEYGSTAFYILEGKASVALILEPFGTLAKKDMNALTAEGIRLLKFVAPEAKTRDVKLGKAY